MTSIPSKKFHEMLLSFSQSEFIDERRRIEDSLWDEFGAEYAVFVLDMSGFSLLTRKYGIVHYLSMVRRMQATTEPIVRSYGGFMIKYEADNCFAVFPDPLSAVNAAIAMQHAFAAENLLTSEDLDIHISCGIDYGKILIIHEIVLVTLTVHQNGRRPCRGRRDPCDKEDADIHERGDQSAEMNASISGIIRHLIEYRSEENPSSCQR
jgi:hypothetical protein